MKLQTLCCELRLIIFIIFHELQSGFVPQRLITNNELIEFDCFHHMQIMKNGRKDIMAIKLHMSKAYDRVKWHFLKEVTISMGFPNSWISLVVRCVTTISFFC